MPSRRACCLFGVVPVTIRDYDVGILMDGWRWKPLPRAGGGAVRRQYAMKCTICGHSTLPGAMLCVPCRAALKRARYVSVQIDSPSSMMQGRPRRSRVKVGALAAPPASPSAAKVLAAHVQVAKPGRPAARTVLPLLRNLAVAVVAVAALGVAAWLGQSPEGTAVPTAEPQVPVHVDATNVGSTAVDAVTPAPTAPLPAPAVAAVPASPVDATPPPPPRKTRAPRVAAPAPARDASPAVASSAPRVEAYEMMPEPQRPAPAARIPVPLPPPPPDRWQTMRDSLARCDREGGIGGFICDQRVRLDSCEGYWGKVPQCPLPPENPR